MNQQRPPVVELHSLTPCFQLITWFLCTIWRCNRIWRNHHNYSLYIYGLKNFSQLTFTQNAHFVKRSFENSTSLQYQIGLKQHILLIYVAITKIFYNIHNLCTQTTYKYQNILHFRLRLLKCLIKLNNYTMRHNKTSLYADLAWFTRSDWILLFGKKCIFILLHFMYFFKRMSTKWYWKE